MTAVTDTLHELLVDPDAEQRVERAAAIGEGPVLIYTVDGKGGEPHRVAACGVDDLGFALQTLTEEGQISGRDNVGVRYRPDPAATGVWWINPYAHGAKS